MSVRDRIRDPNIFRIYGATFALGLAYGMAISLIAVFLDQRGFGKDAIGTLAAWFALGIVSLSLPMGALIARFSAKVTLAASLAGYALSVTLFPFMDSYGAIAAVRLFDGACSVGVWVSSETILLARAERRNKAFVTSLYSIMIAVGYVLGPLSARLLAGIAPYSLVFVAAGVIALGACVYVALAVDRDLPSAAGAAIEASAETLGGAAHCQSDAPCRHPAAGDFPLEAGASPQSTPSSAGAILWRIKNSCYATFAYGYFQSSVVLFLPLYLIEQKGIRSEQTILVPAYFAAGMLLFSNIGGRIGDTRGHLGVMRILAAIGTAMILGFVYLESFTVMAAAVFVAGATLATISPLSLALQGVVVRHDEYARANSLYNAFYALGMLLGPPISSQIFERFGGGPMLFHLAALWAGFVLFSMAFYRDDPAAIRAGVPSAGVSTEA